MEMFKLKLSKDVVQKFRSGLGVLGMDTKDGEDVTLICELDLKHSREIQSWLALVNAIIRDSRGGVKFEIDKKALNSEISSRQHVLNQLRRLHEQT